MVALAKTEAVTRLRNALVPMAPDDLREVYNDLFPQHPLSADEVAGDPIRVERRLADYIGRGLAVEEILDLWPTVFPGEPRLGYDEETEEFFFSAAAAVADDD